MRLSIIIPLFNESGTILKVLERLNSIKYPDFVEYWEVIVVNDCSNDGSGTMVEEFIQERKNFRLVNHERNLGKGSSVRTGANSSSGNVLLIQDADLELYPEDIPSMLIAMHQLNVLFINGSRYLPGIVRPLHSYKRYIGNKFFSLLTSLIIDVKITDMACGYKLISKDLFYQINPTENRFAIEAELILKALKIQKNTIAEVPVRYFPRNRGEGKKLRNNDAFKVLWTILRIGLFR